MSLFNRVPERGEEIIKGDLKFKVIDSDKRCVKIIEIENLS